MKDLEMQRLAKRFWAKVKIDGLFSCWLWTGAIGGNSRSPGQPQIRIAGKTRLANRVVWELTYGTIPKGMCVLHKCDVPRCLNPNHLFLGTQADNIRDMDEKGRRHSRDARGERNGSNCKLKDADVREIRQLAQKGTHTQRAIASLYGISQFVVWSIIHRKMWKHVA